MESALNTKLRPEDDALTDVIDPDSPHGPWSKLELLVAAVRDEIAALRHVQIARAGVKSDPPEPIRRPGVTGHRRAKATPAAVAYLADIRERNNRARGTG